MIKKNNIVSLLLSIVTFKLINGQFSNTPCIEYRTCLPLEKCLSMYSQLVDKTCSHQDFKMPHCGYNENSINVCCPLETSSGEVRFSDETTFEPRLHPNFELLPKVCGNTLNERIVGGSEAYLDEFPWMVQLLYEDKNGKRSLCDGTMINQRYALTTASCVTSKFHIKYVRIGEFDQNTDPDCERSGRDIYCADPIIDIRIEKIIGHKEYDPRKHIHDIALIRLKTPINKGDFEPICLPTSNYLINKNYVNIPSIISGWTRGHNILQKINAYIITNDECNKLIKKYGINVQSRQTCATNHIFDVCFGLPGDPIHVMDLSEAKEYRYVQYGIMSFGLRTCTSEIPTIFTKVGFYMNWILDNIKK